MIRRFLLGIFALQLFASAGASQSRYFPPGSLGADSREDQFVYSWYSKQLKALDEPSLWALSKTEVGQSYRFLWLRTFHHPAAIRIDVNGDGTSQLTSKMCSGAGGYDPGHLIRNDKITLTKEQTDWFLGKIEENGFWKLASADTSAPGNDGSQWVIEGVKDGNYHLVDRWTPRDGPVRIIGLLMLNDLAKEKIPVKEMY
jgi:hypothetical protein